MNSKSNAELAAAYQCKVELIAKRARHLMGQSLPPEYVVFQRMELWAERYEARRQYLQNPQAADRAVLDRQMRRNAERTPQKAIPVDTDSIEAFEQIHSLQGSEAHPFGPSLRNLWWRTESWAGLEQWLLHVPAPSEPPAAECRTSLTWGPDWTAEVNGAAWAVELGDFPDEPMYQLRVNGEPKCSMQDWPEAWTRPEGPGWKAPVPLAKKAVPKDIDAAKLADRYGQGDCEAVWRDLLRLGSAVSKAPYRKAAQEVCDEMVRRSRHNVQLLFERLHAMGYQFWSREHRQFISPPLRAIQAGKVAGVWNKLNPDEKEVLRGMKEDGIHLPMALDAWLRGIGAVSFAGFHPELCPAGSPLLADPLVVLAALDFEDWEAGDTLLVSMGDEEKATLQRDPDWSDGAYTVTIGTPAADAIMQDLWYEATFTGYLRKSFAWGGFPGWERYPDQRPEAMLAHLREGLLPV